MAVEFDNDNEHVSYDYSKKHLYDYFFLEKLFLSKEVLSRYYLSLKTKPFVILSGISGTGKTKIAQLFADYICQDDEDKNAAKRKAFVSVRPDWMDNKGLLGYYNILTNKYHSTPVLEVLLEAQDNKDKPYFVVLDEMNLAKVEHYFSDFLSILESRTEYKKEGEEIRLHSSKNVFSENEKEIPSKIHVPSNVFFAGTVNIDESTYMFSPKVLDRANVIEFNDVDLSAYSKGYLGKDHFSLLNGNVLECFFDREINSPFCKKDDYLKLEDKGKAYLIALQDILKKYNLHFGYRVANELGKFVNLAVEEVGESCFDDALDIQIMQKILPKLHGTRAKLEEPLNKLLTFCCGRSVDITEDLLKKALSYDQSARFPRSAQKIARMLSQLKIQGYASFVE